MIRYSCLSISKSAPFETMFGTIPWRKNVYESATVISNHNLFEYRQNIVPISDAESET